MLWLTHNQITAAIAASSEQLHFPASNLGSLLACDVWRSKGLAATETLTCVFGQAYTSLNSFWLAIQGHTFSTSCSAVSYRLTHGTGTEPLVNVPFSGVTSVLQQVPLAAGHNYQSIQIKFTKLTAAHIVQVGKAYVGPAFDAGAVDEPTGGYARQFGELVNADKAVLGQRFAEPRANFWVSSLQVPYTTEAVQAQIRAIWKAHGTHTPFWLVLDKAAAGQGEFDTPRFCRVAAVPEERLVGAGGSGLLWGLSFNLEEQL